MTEIAAVLVKSKPSAPGEFKYFTNMRCIAGMTFMCPCGCGEIGSLAFDIDDPAPAPVGWVKRPTWHWDGETDKPTLSPSVEKIDGCKWHGHLVAGVWKG